MIVLDRVRTGFDSARLARLRADADQDAEVGSLRESASRTAGAISVACDALLTREVELTRLLCLETGVLRPCRRSNRAARHARSRALTLWISRSTAGFLGLETGKPCLKMRESRLDDRFKNPAKGC